MKHVLCFFGKHDWQYRRAVNEKNPSGWHCLRCSKFIQEH